MAQAIAVREGRILAVGSDADMLALAGPATRRVDAGGRTVIPGLIDSHMHAVRAALSYSTEVNWIGAHTIPEAMQRLREGARARPGQWVVVAGGWTELQFAEKRKPTLAEVMAAVPDQPVWVQMFYSHLLLTPKAQEALALSNASLPAGMALERDAAGAPTGWATASIVNMSALFDKLPRPTYQDNVAGTRQFFTELNRLALTGVVDPGGFSIYPSQYAALLQLWRERQLTLRVAYSLFAQKPGAELAEYRDLTQMLPMGFGDDMLRFNGIGERITIAMYNNNQPDAATREKFLEVARWAAHEHMALTIHWQEDASAPVLLDLFEQVNRETPIAPLRWSIAHLDNASPATLARMKALGVGWTMQDAMYLSGDRIAAQAGPAAAHMPPLVTALRLGVPVGAGTDAHRVASYNPFVALQWMLDGRTVGGRATRGAEETPTREQALRLYTLGSAWFSFDERKRGSLEPGKLADFAVLDRDFFGVPVAEIGGTVSLLTVVGGKPVYAAAPFALQ
ncbi:amidohydrolase [Ramlibacter sp. G-1-2-2]|uniref:Amidohydrolase n=2 Tax=Ramlibacter agri TaxID=2728837 RepID=A0A848GXL6_9BURK|nr:amidohydrolase [Ramlibacter agri]